MIKILITTELINKRKTLFKQTRIRMLNITSRELRLIAKERNMKNSAQRPPKDLPKLLWMSLKE